jgi:putative tryptophan/tyrosine transport system substrate-binding protein
MSGNNNPQTKSPKVWALLTGVMIAAMFLSGCGGDSKPKTFTIGIVSVAASSQPVVDGFKAGLVEAGYVEGQNVTYIYDGAVTADALPALFESLRNKKVDLVFSIGTPPTVQAKKSLEGTNIPVVFGPVSDPVKSGFVADLLKPGGNFTGIQVGNVNPKRLEWLMAVAPGIKRIYVVHNPDDSSSVQGLAALTEAASIFKVELETREARTPDEITAALGTIPDNVDALFMLTSPLFTAQIDAFVEAANQHKLSLSAPNISSVEAGALMAFGTESNAVGRQSARLADQILRGVKPADLPVETADSVLGLNLKTANSIGLTIPDAVIRQSKVVIR